MNRLNKILGGVAIAVVVSSMVWSCSKSADETVAPEQVVLNSEPSLMMEDACFWGWVTTFSGEPVNGAIVEIYRYNKFDWTDYALIADTFTDANGYFQYYLDAVRFYPYYYYVVFKVYDTTSPVYNTITKTVEFSGGDNRCTEGGAYVGYADTIQIGEAQTFSK